MDFFVVQFSDAACVRSTNVMRPLSKSYGVISTWTFSPALTQMRALRIFPHIVANIIWPFSRRTRNIVFGNLSSTVPEKTITSSFAMYKNPLFCCSFEMILANYLKCKNFLFACKAGTFLIEYFKECMGY